MSDKSAQYKRSSDDAHSSGSAVRWCQHAVETGCFRRNPRRHPRRESPTLPSTTPERRPEVLLLPLVLTSSFVQGTVKSVMLPAGRHRFSMTKLALEDGTIKVIAYQDEADKLYTAVQNAQVECTKSMRNQRCFPGSAMPLPLRVYEARGREIREGRRQPHVGGQCARGH